MKVYVIKNESLSLILSLGLSFLLAAVDRRLRRCVATVRFKKLEYLRNCLWIAAPGFMFILNKSSLLQ